MKLGISRDGYFIPQDRESSQNFFLHQMGTETFSPSSSLEGAAIPNSEGCHAVPAIAQIIKTWKVLLV
jgi:hypothetical protein